MSITERLPPETDDIAMVIYRCRKCRQNLQIKNYNNNYGCPHEVGVQDVLYLDIDNCPVWIEEAITQANWTKGKLYCMKCEGRLGSFDFVNQKLCTCRQHSVLPIHLLKARIDEMIIRNRPTQLSRDGMRDRPPYLLVRHTLCDRERYTAGGNKSSTDTDNIVLQRASMSHTHSDHSDHRDHSDRSDRTPVSSDDTNSDIYTDISDSNVHSVGMSPDTIVSPAGMSPDARVSPVITTGCLSAGNISQLDATSEQPDNVLDSTDISPGLSATRTVSVYNRYDVLITEIQDSGSTENQQSKTTENPNLTSSEQFDWMQTDIEIPSELTCSVCLELLYRPHRCEPCRHVFCEPCLRQIRRTNPTRTPCPLCRNIIYKCCLQTDMMDRIDREYCEEFKKRKHEIRKKIKESYPLPSHSSELFSRSYPYQPPGRSRGSVFLTTLYFLLLYIRYILLNYITSWSAYRTDVTRLDSPIVYGISQCLWLIVVLVLWMGFIPYLLRYCLFQFGSNNSIIRRLLTLIAILYQVIMCYTWKTLLLEVGTLYLLRYFYYSPRRGSM